MSKASKSRSAQYRAKVKRERKAAAEAKYESYRDSGTNSKRASLKRKRSKQVRVERHAGGRRCPNSGCPTCFPQLLPAGRQRAYLYAMRHDMMQAFRKRYASAS